jgi:hypothetical protein
MTGTHTCAHCGIQWYAVRARPDPTFPDCCSPQCVDAWMDAHPDEKQRRQWITRQDLVDRACARTGLIPMPREVPARGDN